MYMTQSRDNCKIIVITSGKGGVGKTTTTANLGVGLAMKGYKVALIDTDTGLRNLDLLLGLENRIMYDLVDVTSGRVPYKKALVRHKKYEHLFLLPTSQIKDKLAVSPGQVTTLCQEMSSEFDFILIDCPAGIEQGFKTAVAAADIALIVTMPEISAVRDADKIIGELMRAGDESFLGGHDAHTSLIQREAAGDPVNMTLMITHAEDQLMAAESFKIVAAELIDVYRRMEKDA